MHKKTALVGIVTPTHDSEETIKETIDSILSQTFSDFKIFVVDDHSKDNTVKIVKEMAKKDNRIFLCELEDQKNGASSARNRAIELINIHGIRYVAFLDGDDLWRPEKLKTQLDFMKKEKVAFTYSDYEIYETSKNEVTKYRKSPKKVTSLRMQIGDSIGCLTVMYDSAKVGLISIPDLKKRNDYALWCLILKRVKYGKKCPGILATYKRNSGGLSSGNKRKLLKYHYEMHRNINGKNPIISAFLCCTNVINYFINIIFKEHKVKK